MITAGKRVAIYARVSTKDKGQTTENQKAEPTRWAETPDASLRPSMRIPYPEAKAVMSALALMRGRVFLVLGATGQA
jgi:hypothetical protein